MGRRTLTLCSIFAFLLTPTTSHAHGEEDHGGDGLDTHHEALEAHLKEKMQDAYDAPVAGLGAASLERGAELYETQCASCHGTQGAGDGPESASYPMAALDLTDATQLDAISDAGLIEVIRAGLTEGGMPAFEQTLSHAEILDVYAHTKTFRATHDDETMSEEAGCSVGSYGHGPEPSWWFGAGLLLVWGRRRKSSWP